MILLKKFDELKKMRYSGKLLAQILDVISKETHPGVTTSYLNYIAESLCYKNGAIPAFKGYCGYKYSLCCSVNQEVVHGFPRNVKLLEGDVLSVDFGVIIDKYYGDSAMTIPVGNINPNTKRLIDITRKSLNAGIDKMWPGCYLGDVSFAIQNTIEQNGFGVVKEYVGHGIGKSLHEEPQVPNFGEKNCGIELKEGMVLAIEPMATIGNSKTKVLQDGWTVVTVDKSISAHFEHTVAVTKNGPWILSEI